MAASRVATAEVAVTRIVALSQLREGRRAGQLNSSVSRNARSPRFSHDLVAMSHRRTAARIPILACAALGACGSPTEPGAHDEPALLRFAEQTARMSAPDTVALGAEVPLSVSTFGGGCTREAARAEVSPVPQTNGGSVVVRLFNRNTGARICSSDGLTIEHRVTVPATARGHLIVRVEGANQGMETNWNVVPWVLTRTVYVR